MSMRSCTLLCLDSCSFVRRNNFEVMVFKYSGDKYYIVLAVAKATGCSWGWSRRGNVGGCSMCAIIYKEAVKMGAKSNVTWMAGPETLKWWHEPRGYWDVFGFVVRAPVASVALINVCSASANPAVVRYSWMRGVKPFHKNQYADWVLQIWKKW